MGAIRQGEQCSHTVKFMKVHESVAPGSFVLAGYSRFFPYDTNGAAGVGRGGGEWVVAGETKWSAIKVTRIFIDFPARQNALFPRGITGTRNGRVASTLMDSVSQQCYSFSR